MTFNCNLSIICAAVAVALAGLLHDAQSLTRRSSNSDKQIPSHCHCRDYKLPGPSGTCEYNPDCYPDHEILNITLDCLPSVPENHRLCYRTMVRKCTVDNSLSLKCRLFKGPKDFRGSKQLLVGSNPRSVDITSDNNFENRTVCFYNVDLSGSPNCSTLRLFHKEGHPQDKYIDSLNVSHPCPYLDNACKDYLQIYYEDDEGSEQNLKLCREELANLDKSLPNVTSFRAVFWLDSTPQSGSSFQVRAECLE